MTGDPPERPPVSPRFSPRFRLEPKPGFNRLAVSWGGPDERVTLTCSYCDAPFGDGEMPLLMTDPQGWTAAFCEACALRWWDIERLA